MKQVMVAHWEAQGQIFTKREDAEKAEFRAYLMDKMGYGNEDAIDFMWEHRKEIIRIITQLETF